MSRAAPAAPPPALREALFANPALRPYAVADCAARPGLHAALEASAAEQVVLMSGELSPEADAVAPRLIALDPDGEAMELLAEGWGRAEAIYLLSPLTPAALGAHALDLTQVQLPDRRLVHFRYYDPRVLRDVAPLLTDAQRREFFGDAIAAVVCEDESGAGLARFAP